MHRSDILKAADALINGDREAAYGPPIINFTNIAKGWSVLLGVEVRPSQVAECMAWLKKCRKLNGYHEDSYVDDPAYSALAGELANIEKQLLDAEELRSNPMGCQHKHVSRPLFVLIDEMVEKKDKTRQHLAAIAEVDAQLLTDLPAPSYQMSTNAVVPGFEYSGTSFIDPEADGPTDFGR